MRKRARESEEKLSHMATGKYKLGELLGAGAFSDVRKLGDRYAIKLPGEAASELFLLEMNYFIALSARGLAPIIYNIDLNRNIVVVDKLTPMRSVVAESHADAGEVATQVLSLMSHMAICGVCCCDMKLENVAFDAGTMMARLIDPGLEFTCFLWGKRPQNNIAHPDHQLPYALVTGMLMIFIVASFCAAAYQCLNRTRHPICTCDSCSELQKLREPFVHMLNSLNSKPYLDHVDTMVCRYNDKCVLSEKRLEDCVNAMYAHYARGYRTIMSMPYRAPVPPSAEYDENDDVCLAVLTEVLIDTTENAPIFADFSTENVNCGMFASDITIEDDDVTISESTTPSTINHSSDNLGNFGT
jgi:hypothetical protein